MNHGSITARPGDPGSPARPRLPRRPRGTSVRLVDDDTLIARAGHRYRPDAGLLDAANAALALQRPLLLTGEPGCGKTEFAFAAAQQLGARPEAGPSTPELLSAYIRSDTRARDLLYDYDEVRRFGDSHQAEAAAQERSKDPRNYIRLRALGEALCSPDLRVLLIDEIDKAPRDVPNDLLHELEARDFEIGEIADEALRPGLDGTPLRRRMTRENQAGLLMIFTSNAERALPDAFLRRCVFWHIDFPRREQLEAIIRSYFDQWPELDSLIEPVMDIFAMIRDREMGLARRPGTSELLDWIEALITVHAYRDARGRIVAALGNPSSERAWSELPSLGCLIKQQRDRDLLLGERR